MASCDHAKRRSRRIAVALLAAPALLLGCRAAAATFLDLPQQPIASKTAGSASAVAAQQVEDTAPPPAIESVTNRDSVLKLLPKDVAGYVDWMAALTRGVIRPRSSLPGKAAPAPTTGFGYDFLMKGAKATDDAFFPHSSHVQWLNCATCHPRIFPYRSATITMDSIDGGKQCGLCHRSIAFSADACGRCHPAVGLDEGSGTAELGNDLRLPRRVTSADTSKSVSSAFPPAVFRHWTHRIRYRCSVCHPDLFEPRLGADTLRMADMQTGGACGACHNGQAAFGIVQCDRCHIPAKSSGAKKQ